MPNLIRILCVFSTLDRGGAESMCMNLYRHIDRDKVQFDFVKHSHNKGAFEDAIISLGGRIFEAPRYRIYNHIQYQNWWKTFLSAHPEYKIVHGHYFTISAVYFSVCKAFDCVTVGHSHASQRQRNSLSAHVKSLVELRTEMYADYCLACGRQAGEWLFPHKDFTVLNNAIDSEKFACNDQIRDEVRSELSLQDCFVIGIVGSLQSVKNPFGTIEIFSAIKAGKPNAKLLWIGDGGMREAIEDKIRECDLQGSIVMTGVRSDVHRMLQAMDAFILPSFSEGLPVVAIEAQAAGLQCFISDRVTTECDITGRCRFLPIDRPEQWAEAVLSSDLSRMDTRQQIIDAGYDIHTTARWLQDFYLKISENGS